MTTAEPGRGRDPAAVALGDLLAVPALSGARVVGEADEDRPIAGIVVADDDAPVEPDCLLLSPTPPSPPLPDGCAAVVCRVEPERPLRVPVVVLPAGAAWGPVVTELAQRFATSSTREPAREARRAFRESLLAGGGFGGLASVARQSLGAPVAILDEYLDILGAADLGDRDEERLAEAVTRARGHGPASIIGPFLEQELSDLVRVPVAHGGSASGLLVAFTTAPPSLAQRGLIGELVEAVLLEQAREQVRIETESQMRGELLDELSAGEAVGRESVVRRARHLGADVAPGGVVVFGMLFDPHDAGRVITDERLVRRFMRQARGAIELHWSSALIDWWQDGLVAVLSPTAPGPEEGAEDEVADQAVTLAQRLLAATRETVPGTALTLGVSRYTREPERLGIALEEARLALSIGTRLGRAGELITFEETGTYKLLFRLFADRPDELRDFYSSTLAPLVEYDAKSQTELVHTLSTYLGKDGSLAETAGALFTHRHTVRYRLDRITELIGLDVGRTDDREKLTLALKSMRLLGIRPPASGSVGDADAHAAKEPAQAGRTSKP
ncbi:MAG: PucR family transcriptional regulator [Miltoncostaeaceae bacterium]